MKMDIYGDIGNDEESVMCQQNLNNEESNQVSVDLSQCMWFLISGKSEESSMSIAEAFDEIANEMEYEEIAMDFDYASNELNALNELNGIDNVCSELVCSEFGSELFESAMPTEQTAFDSTLLNLHTHVGSMEMQQLLAESNLARIDSLIERVVYFHSCGMLDLAKLSCDIYGNFVVQKLFENAATQSRKSLFMAMVPGNTALLCSSSYGCWVMQTVIDSVDSECISMLLSEIQGASPPISDKINHPHYNHVLQKLIEYGMAYADIRFIADAIQGNLSYFCGRQFGCRVAQALISNYPSDIDLSCIVTDSNVDICNLASMKYGNFVIGCVLDNSDKIGKANRRVVSIVCRDVLLKPDNLLFLSCNKFGSNVVEKCIGVCKREQKNQMVRMLTCSKNEYVLKSIANHKFGNYVVQTLMNRCNNKQQKDRIMKAIQPLRSNNNNDNSAKKGHYQHQHRGNKKTYAKHISQNGRRNQALRYQQCV